MKILPEVEVVVELPDPHEWEAPLPLDDMLEALYQTGKRLNSTVRCQVPPTKETPGYELTVRQHHPSVVRTTSAGPRLYRRYCGYLPGYSLQQIQWQRLEIDRVEDAGND